MGDGAFKLKPSVPTSDALDSPSGEKNPVGLVPGEEHRAYGNDQNVKHKLMGKVLAGP